MPSAVPCAGWCEEEVADEVEKPVPVRGGGGGAMPPVAVRLGGGAKVDGSRSCESGRAV